MRHLLPVLALGILLAPLPAQAGRGDGGTTFNSTYPRCGMVGCVSRHERTTRSGGRDQPFRERSFHSSGSRSRY